MLFLMKIVCIKENPSEWVNNDNNNNNQIEAIGAARETLKRQNFNETK
jgi:hypothetical protein